MKIFVAFLSFLSFVSAKEETMVVNTPSGSVKGTSGSSIPSGLTFMSFYSIPYAKAPTGRLRFQNPETFGAWESQLDGTQPPPVCPQWSITNSMGTQQEPLQGQEDCLFLNIHVPKVAFKEGIQLPVMFFIHGGANLMGSSAMAVPNRIMDTEEVILVTANYRLGAFGFLSMEDDVLPGNLGLKDQSLALRWVHDNIAHFGGDPSKVTLWGHSAGARSAFYHTLSPWSQGLFSKVIAQSGGLVSDPGVYFADSPVHYASTFVDTVDCDGSLSTDKIRECLQGKSLEELMDKARIFEKFMFTSNPWKPVVDNFTSKPFVPEQPKTLVESGKFSQVPFLLGFNKNEAAYLMSQFLSDEDLMDDVNDVFDVHGPVLLMGMGEHSATEEDSATANIYRLHYMGGDNVTISRENIALVEKMFSDVKYARPVNKMADLLRKHGKESVYYYKYSHRGQFTSPDSFHGHDSSKLDLGVSHGDEMFMLFGKELNANDSKMAKKLVSMWTKFATSGNPDPSWSPLDPTAADPSYAKLSTSPLKMSYCLDFKKDMQFLAGLEELVENYRNFNADDHPAIQTMIKEKGRIDAEAMQEDEGYDPRDEF